MKIHKISAELLSIEQIGEIVYGGYKIELSDDAQRRISECRKYLDKKIEESTVPIYGVTTGFGSLCNVSIGSDYLAQLQINLMMSHACGTGDRVPNDIVKIMLLLKIQSLSYGFSGCQLATVNRRLLQQRCLSYSLYARFAWCIGRLSAFGSSLVASRGAWRGGI